jgi:hypothetical protein
MGQIVRIIARRRVGKRFSNDNSDIKPDDSRLPPDGSKDASSIAL